MNPTDSMVVLLVGAVIGLSIGAASAVAIYRQRLARQGLEARDSAARILAEAEGQARETLLAAKDDALAVRDAAERDAKGGVANSTRTISDSQAAGRSWISVSTKPKASLAG